jgi:ferredoxin-like protein FixX
MSDDPRPLKAVLLEDASTPQKAEFAEMLAEACARAEARVATERPWFFVLSPTEYERMKPYALPPDYDKCPKCGTGRVVCEVYHGNIGVGLTLKCRRGGGGCDFEQYISDPE